MESSPGGKSGGTAEQAERLGHLAHGTDSEFRSSERLSSPQAGSVGNTQLRGQYRGTHQWHETGSPSHLQVGKSPRSYLKSVNTPKRFKRTSLSLSRGSFVQLLAVLALLGLATSWHLHANIRKKHTTSPHEPASPLSETGRQSATAKPIGERQDESTTTSGRLPGVGNLSTGDGQGASRLSLVEEPMGRLSNGAVGGDGEEAGVLDKTGSASTTDRRSTAGRDSGGGEDALPQRAREDRIRLADSDEARAGSKNETRESAFTTQLADGEDPGKLAGGQVASSESVPGTLRPKEEVQESTQNGPGRETSGAASGSAREEGPQLETLHLPKSRAYQPLTKHSMTDEELFRTVLAMRRKTPHRPKIAFMFLTRGPLPLAPLWARFFKGHGAFFSIYIHAKPGHQYPRGRLPRIFRNRTVPSQVVRWGDASMVEAERRLLGNALLDPRNMHFVLLSESCIPLFPFPYVYNYIVSSKQSFVAVSKDPRENITWGEHMLPEVTREQWMKGSEWKELHREAALIVIEDTKYFAKFANHCRPPCNPYIKGYIDERYVPTLLTLKAPDRIANRTLMWADWKRHYKWAHPHTYEANETTWETILELRNITRYTTFSLGGVETDCTINGTGSYPCYLFARKFAPSTLRPLLQLQELYKAK